MWVCAWWRCFTWTGFNLSKYCYRSNRFLFIFSSCELYINKTLMSAVCGLPTVEFGFTFVASDKWPKVKLMVPAVKMYLFNKYEHLQTEWWSVLILIVDLVCSGTNALISSFGFSHFAFMNQTCSIFCQYRSHRLFSVKLTWCLSSFSLILSGRHRCVWAPLPAVMETLNIDAVIIQGHVDTQASVCKIGLAFDVNW